MKKDIDNYDKYYKKNASLYNKIRLDHENDFNHTIEIIREYAGVGDIHLLDIGCGTGKYGERLAEFGYKVNGVDKSQDQIKEAQKIIDAQVANALNLPFEENSYDLCIMIMVIHQMEESEKRIKAFKEAYRVLKPGGFFIIKTCSHKDLENRLTSRFFSGCLEDDQKRYPDIAQLEKELNIFSKINIRPESVIVSHSKSDLINRFRQRKSSNMMEDKLSEKQLHIGIQKFKEYYENEEQVIEREKHNTFFICSKE